MKLKTNKLLLFLFLPMIFPYLILFALICIFTGFLMETVFLNNGLFVIFVLIILYIIALILSGIIFIKSIITKRDSKELLYTNMIIKLVHIPAYIIIFFIGLLSLITIFTMGITIVLILLDCMTIFLSGLIGLSGIIRGFIENKLSKKAAVIHAVCQFIFCADIISCIIIYRKVKNS
jgi:hypothetical protein